MLTEDSIWTFIKDSFIRDIKVLLYHKTVWEVPDQNMNSSPFICGLSDISGIDQNALAQCYAQGEGHSFLSPAVVTSSPKVQGLVSFITA